LGLRGHRVKAVALFSGGLDSILAAWLITDQGIDVEALYFKTVFWGKYDNKLDCSLLENAAFQARAELTVVEVDKAFFDVVKNPAHGYGKNLNPCIDCRIFILKTAKEYMRKKGASFLITGEVLGQRPMSQHRSILNKIENASGVSGIIVRPLSARFFKASIPEQQGWIDRERLFAMEGRSRKPQLALAQKLGIKDFPNPSGGCLLADKIFSDKMRDMIKYEKDFQANDINLIKSGRVFRLSPKAKLVVGRNEKQNNLLLDLAKNTDYSFKTVDIPGPVGIGRGCFDADTIYKAASIIARYSDLEPGRKANIFYKKHHCDIDESISVMPAKEDELSAIRI
jgi:tRNA U34 2-thiouridine synthase MnmA/TrmU